jgi:hypothetical protein
MRHIPTAVSAVQSKEREVRIMGAKAEDVRRAGQDGVRTGE